MRFIVSLFVVIVLGFAANSCKKPDNNNITGGGKGGTSIINVTGEHHGSLLDTCTIYIKYNTVDAPGNGIYDDSAVCALVNEVPVASFTGLTTGNYYVLAVGLHGGFSPPNVKGGKTITISTPGTVSDTIPTYQY